MKKYLTICQGGQVRSVGMKFALTYKYKFGEAIALGVEGNSQETIRDIARMCDEVILMDKTLKDGVPKGIDYLICDVGADTYGNPFHPELQQKISDWLVINGKFL